MLLFIGSVVLVFLFIFSAFWSGAETALTSLSKYRIKKLIALNKPLSATLGQWLKSPYYLLSTIIIGNTTNDLVLSYLATLIFLQIFSSLLPFASREVIEFINWLLVTFLLLVLGEVTPKVYARRNPEKVTLAVLPILSRVMGAANALLSPLIAPVKKLFPGINLVPVGRLSYVSLEEIKGLITEANTSGLLGTETSRMLEGVLKLGNL
ncbi:MAG: CNNM domain-containing protein, partial [Endomicrobiales bacterium]